MRAWVLLIVMACGVVAGCSGANGDAGPDKPVIGVSLLTRASAR